MTIPLSGPAQSKPRSKGGKRARKVEIGAQTVAGGVGSAFGAAKLRDSYKVDAPGNKAKLHRVVASQKARAVKQGVTPATAARVAHAVEHGHPGFKPLLALVGAGTVATGAHRYQQITHYVRSKRDGVAKASLAPGETLGGMDAFGVEPLAKADDGERARYYGQMKHNMGTLAATGATLATGSGIIGHLERKGHDPMGFAQLTSKGKPYTEAGKARKLKPIVAAHRFQTKVASGVGVGALGLAAAYKRKEANARKQVAKSDRTRKASDVGLGAGTVGLGGAALHYGSKDASILAGQAKIFGKEARAAHHMIAGTKQNSWKIPEEAVSRAKQRRLVGARVTAVKGPGALIAGTGAIAGGAAILDTARHAAHARSAKKEAMAKSAFGVEIIKADPSNPREQRDRGNRTKGGLVGGAAVGAYANGRVRRPTDSKGFPLKRSGRAVSRVAHTGKGAVIGGLAGGAAAIGVHERELSVKHRPMPSTLGPEGATVAKSAFGVEHIEKVSPGDIMPALAGVATRAGKGFKFGSGVARDAGTVAGGVTRLHPVVVGTAAGAGGLVGAGLKRKMNTAAANASTTSTDPNASPFLKV